MKNPLPLLALVTLVATVPLSTARADERDDKIKALEQKYEQLDQKYRDLERRIEGGPASDKSKAAPALVIGASGFSMRSADTNFTLRFRGLAQLDSRTYLDDGGIGNNDTFALRRARLGLEGTVFRDFDFLFTPEFGGGSPNLRDAWLNYRYTSGLQLRVGKMKPPGSLERGQGVANSTMIERSLVAALTPTRDVGILLHGELWPGAEDDTKRLGWEGLVNYAFGVFNGVSDDRNSANTDVDDEKSFAGRLFFHPFLNSRATALKGLGLGVAGSYGNVEGANSLPPDRGYSTLGQQRLFSYRSGAGTSDATADVTADGAHWRAVPQLYYYHGPFGLLGEYAISSPTIKRRASATTFGMVQHCAWGFSASWLLTGEDATFKRVVPKKNFDPRNGGWGAWQLAVQFSQLDLDGDTFPQFADPSMSARRAATWGAGVNWYLNRNVRASFNFFQTDFAGGDADVVTRQDENVFATRFQLSF